MAIRKGITPATSPTANVHLPSSVRGRVVARPVAAPEPQRQPARVITNERPTLREAPVRGLIVDAGGKPLRGLSQHTIEAHKAHTEDATELCGGSCGQLHPPAQMKTVVGNAYNSNNPLRLCESCAKLAYKNPYNQDERWQPSVPKVRFDRETGATYDAHKRGVSISELVTRDTYHRESEVEDKYKAEHAPREGQWSGGGRVGHAVRGRR